MGRAVDSVGEGIPRAEIRFDGAPASCDGLGRFQGTTRADGRIWIEVTCAGYAPTNIEAALVKRIRIGDAIRSSRRQREQCTRAKPWGVAGSADARPWGL